MSAYFKRRDRRFLGAGIIGAAQIEDASVTASKMAAAAIASAALAETVLRYAEVTITAAQITATGAGNLGHADGVPLVAAPGSGKVIELVSASLIYDYATAAYGAGGNITVNYAGGAALTGIVSNANSLGASGDKVVVLYPLTTVAVPLLVNTGLNLVAAVAYTQPGTAAGVARVKVVYRVHTTGL
jgi:hypothetical protein